MPGKPSCQQPLIRNTMITVTRSQDGAPLALTFANLSTTVFSWVIRDHFVHAEMSRRWLRRELWSAEGDL